MSTREAVRASRPRLEEHTLQDGKKVFVRGFSGVGRAAYFDYREKALANGGVRSWVVAAMALCEEDGRLAYDWEKDDDLAEVREIDAADLDEIMLKAFSLSGLKKKALEEAEGN